MTFVIKHKPQPGAPMVAEYVCPEHGRFEALVQRDENGDPPSDVNCGAIEEGEDDDGIEYVDQCLVRAELVVSAPKVKFWSRDPVPIGYASKSDEKDPRALDTEPLATGKMTKAEWRKWQRGISQERRYQRRLKAGKISKRIQVGGG